MTEARVAREIELRDQIERMAHRTAAVTALVAEYTAPLDGTAWVLLRLIDRSGSVRASELAAAGRMSRPSVSRCLAALEQSGLVAADPDPDDRRASLVSLTGDGRAFIAHLAEIGRQRMREITAGFTVDEVDQLSHLLRRLNDNADRHVVAPARYHFERLDA